MTGDDDRYDRRTVLRATGVAVGATAGLVGGASASVPSAVEFVTDYRPYVPPPNECGGGDLGPVVEEGTQMDVLSKCTRNGTEYYYGTVETATLLSAVWVPPSVVEPV